MSALAVMQYVQDYDGHFPIGEIITTQTPPDGAHRNPYQKTWQNITFPYMKDVSSFYCPAGLTSVTDFRRDFDPARGNYGANRAIIPISTDEHPQAGARLADIVQAQDTYLLFDSGYFLMSAESALSPLNASTYIPGTAEYFSQHMEGTWYEADFRNGRHENKKVNVAFADGHIKLLDSSALIDQAKMHREDRAKSSWNP